MFFFFFFLHIESLLSISEPSERWDFRNREGTICAAWRKHFKCKSEVSRTWLTSRHYSYAIELFIWWCFQIGPARFRAPELLFRPDLIGDESSGIHEVLAYAIQKSDMDLRRTLFSNIVLCGGSTLIKGWYYSVLVLMKLYFNSGLLLELHS